MSKKSRALANLPWRREFRTGHLPVVATGVGVDSAARKMNHIPAGSEPAQGRTGDIIALATKYSHAGVGDDEVRKRVTASFSFSPTFIAEVLSRNKGWKKGTSKKKGKRQKT